MQAKRVNIVTLKMVREKSFLYESRQISSPAAAYEIGRFIEDSDREKFVVLSLNAKNEPNCIEVVSIGNLSNAIVCPREVFKSAILANASAVVLFHNHPSGDDSPSEQDIEITRQLKNAGSILGICIYDHIIIGKEGKFVSLKERGYV